MLLKCHYRVHHLPLGCRQYPHLLDKDLSMIDFNNKGFFKLKQNDEYAERVTALLLDAVPGKPEDVWR